MSEIAIYHPLIDPDDAELLKTAALYWDGLRTIVPGSMRDPYQSPSSAEALREGFLKPRYVSPECAEVVKASNEFASDIDSPAIRADVRRARNTAGSCPGRFQSLHGEKLSARLKAALFAGASAQPDGFYRVAEGFGNPYMSRLASVVAEADKASPLTNISTSQDVVVDRHAEVLGSKAAQTAEGELARLTLQAVGIRPDVPLVEVLRFRNTHRDELDSLRRQIRRLCRSLTKQDSVQHLQRDLQALVEDEIRPGLDELRARLHEHGIAFGVSSLDIVQASIVGLLGSGVSDWLYGVAGGVLSLAISACRARRERQRLLDEDPLSYLLAAQSQLE